MAGKRPRYIVTGSMKFNDVSAKGQRLMYVGPCTAFGARSSKSNKIPKDQIDHKLFKFIDKKWLNKYKLKGFETFTVSNTMKDRMVTKEDEMAEEQILALVEEAIPILPVKASKSKATKKRPRRKK